MPTSKQKTELQQLTERLDELQAKLDEQHDNPSTERALQLCNAAGFTVLGFGGRRVAVALSPDKVAKLAWLQTGLGDNAVEWRMWQASEPEVQALLAPTLWHTAGGVNIQGRCLPVVAEAFYDPQTLTRRLARAGITDAVLNLGLFDGQAVCYDYALLRPETATALLR